MTHLSPCCLGTRKFNFLIIRNELRCRGDREDRWGARERRGIFLFFCDYKRNAWRGKEMLAMLEHSHNAEQTKTGRKKKRHPSNVQNTAFHLTKHTAVGAVSGIVNWL